MDMLLAETSRNAWAGVVILLLPFLYISGFFAQIIGLVGGHYRKLQRDDLEAILKMEMIQRGMGAEEIEHILNARTATPQADAASASCPSKAASPGAK
jgi:hypothetical protein